MTNPTNPTSPTDPTPPEKSPATTGSTRTVKPAGAADTANTGSASGGEREVGSGKDSVAVKNSTRPMGGKETALPLHPRRVRRGIHLKQKEGPITESWIGRSWFSRFSCKASNDELSEGIEYARRGQTTRLNIDTTGIHAVVVGRMPRPYEISIRAASFDDDTWNKMVTSVCEQSLLAAKLLAGQFPENTDEIFQARGRSIVPAEEEIVFSCTCGSEERCCKHVICIAALVAEQLDNDPFQILTIRGLDVDRFMEMLRQRRALTQKQGRAAAAYTPAAPEGLTSSQPLELCIDNFWEIDAEALPADIPVEAPEVDLALLRRLGPAPFSDSRFPIVGLLATCYETVTARVLAERSLPDENFESTDS